jgi:ribosomal protein L14E/L6E/L27E
MLVETGRVCIKKCGRDAGDKAVITQVIGKGFVKIITQTRKKERKCNTAHLEFLNEKVDLKNKEDLKKIGITA